VQVGMTTPIMRPDLDAPILRTWARAIDEGPFASVCFGERIAFDNPETLAARRPLSAPPPRRRPCGGGRDEASVGGGEADRVGVRGRTATGPKGWTRPRRTSSQDHPIFAGQKPFGEPATVTDRANGYRPRIRRSLV